MVKITQAMIRLYDDFTHGRMSRTAFEDALGNAAGSPEAAAEAERLIAADAAVSPRVAADDPRLDCRHVAVPGGQDGLSGYLCRPATGSGPLPGVLVVHENRGLNGHVEDVTRRVALAGFQALGLDFLSPGGGTPADEDDARAAIGALAPDAVDTDGRAALDWLRREGAGPVGALGFCWGGAVVGRLACREAALNAAVVYYGRAPAAEAAAGIRAALLLHYAGLDEKVNATAPPFLEALDAVGVGYEKHVYEGANHAFNNDTAAARYNADAARLAWERTVGFLSRELGLSVPE